MAKNWGTLRPIPCSWQQPGAHSGAGDAQYLPNPGKSSGQTGGSPHPPHCCPSPGLLGCFYWTRGHRGGHLGTCGCHRWSPGHQVEPKPCQASQSLAAKGSFQNMQAPLPWVFPFWGAGFERTQGEMPQGKFCRQQQDMEFLN